MPPPELAGHQIVAVEQALETLRRYGGVLLADAPGLGKSFVAAAVAESLTRSGCTVEIAVPASLIRQWRRTIERFEVEARVRSHQSLMSDRSIPTVAERLLIVDEAHAFRNPRTQRYQALARRSIGARVLLITATPLCNRAEDLLALIDLIATDDALRWRGAPSIRRAFQENDRQGIDVTLAELVIRRGHDVLAPALPFGRLERRVIRHPLPEVPSLEQLHFPLLASGASGHLLRRMMIRRLESSEAALAESLIRQKRFYDRALDALAGGRELSRRDYRQLFAAGDEREAMQAILFWDLFAPQSGGARPDALEQEIATIEKVRLELKRSSGAKQALLLERLASDSVPALVFTGSVATARSLFTALRGPRRTGMATSHGCWPADAIGDFSTGKLDVLVATDLVSEGLDLQRAGVVVHYDLPWNPVRLEQRNGRAFRIGQQRPAVTALYFVPQRTGWNSGVVSILAAKNRLRRGILDTPPASEETGDDPSLDARRLALPRRIPADSPEWRLRTALQSGGMATPPALLRPHRAGMAQLIGEMAGEYLETRRVRELETLLDHETRLSDRSSPFLIEFPRP